MYISVFLYHILKHNYLYMTTIDINITLPTTFQNQKLRFKSKNPKNPKHNQ